MGIPARYLIKDVTVLTSNLEPSQYLVLVIARKDLFTITSIHNLVNSGPKMGSTASIIIC